MWRDVYFFQIYTLSLFIPEKMKKEKKCIFFVKYEYNIIIIYSSELLDYAHDFFLQTSAHNHVECCELLVFLQLG